MYCKILSVITTAKKLYYNRLVLNSHNKTKTTWNIVKSVSGKKSTDEIIHQLYIDRGKTNNPQIISDNFNVYFLTIADKINYNNSDSNNMISVINNLSSVACLAVPYFSTLSHKWHDILGKKKSVFSASLQLLSETFILKEFSKISYMYIHLHIRSLLFLPGIKQT
jgi:hypothetical protein